MMTLTDRTHLPHCDARYGNRRGDVERRLDANVTRGTLFSAHHQPDGTYRIVTISGTEFAKVTLAQASMVCSVAMSAFQAGRSDHADRG